jgi:hypothetical protein
MEQFLQPQQQQQNEQAPASLVAGSGFSGVLSDRRFAPTIGELLQPQQQQSEQAPASLVAGSGFSGFSAVVALLPQWERSCNHKSDKMNKL